MIQAPAPHASYRKQLVTYREKLKRLQKKRSQLGWGRLLVFLLTVLLAYQVFTASGLLGLLPTITGIALLLLLVKMDARNSEKIRHILRIIEINEEELQVLDDQFAGREAGLPFLPADHAYANDLDLFGPASLYQWLSRCYTEPGRRRLADNLLEPPAPETAALRQEAVEELAPQIDWRQQGQAFARQNLITLATTKNIHAWLQQEEQHFTGSFWRAGVLLYSFVTLGAAVATLLGYIPGYVFSSLFLLFLIFSLLLSINTVKPYIQLNGIVKETSTLQALIDWLETGTYTAAHLQHLQQGIQSGEGSAGEALRTLKAILDRFDLRTSIIGFLFLNPFLLWDVRQMILLNRWRRQNKGFVQGWFDAVAEMEVLQSLSTLHVNQPSWCFAQFSPVLFTFEGEAVGHPLIPPQRRVDNDFTMAGLAKIGLITGSNMAGKSTFLRSLGVNMVLAQMGSPVCARRFLLSPVQVVSSMRIADNLAENTSTFYAELKKLRTIIERVKAHQPVFILLDEILRGTNSYDRHKGAAALIRQLIRESAVAVIATHDVALAQLEETYPASVTNYHFDVEVEGEELYFDYKLKHGVCKSLNASLLMKKIGIDLA